MPDYNALNLKLLQIGIPFCREKKKSIFLSSEDVGRAGFIFPIHLQHPSFIDVWSLYSQEGCRESCCHCSITSCIKCRGIAQCCLEHKYDVMILKLAEIDKESAERSQCYNFFLFLVRLYLAPVSFAGRAEGISSGHLLRQTQPCLEASSQSSLMQLQWNRWSWSLLNVIYPFK